MDIQKIIPKTRFLSPKEADTLLKTWDSLSKEAQGFIFQILEEGSVYERKMIQTALQGDPQFAINLEHKITDSKKAALKRIEKSEQNEEATDLDNLLNSI